MDVIQIVEYISGRTPLTEGVCRCTVEAVQLQERLRRRFDTRATRRRRPRARQEAGVIGRLHHLVFDCVDPSVEAEFWSAVLGNPITYRDDDFAVVAKDDTTSGIAFQRVVAHVPPDWPGDSGAQQAHVDVMVDDLAAAAADVVRLGARPLGGDHVFADPAGHPFCLIPRPAWAPPVTEGG